ncbi:MAG: FlgD immunoglobulin-like domain containing protein, partial [Candidatus Cloacimonetes bacterium]|nr:FlgD immunoglobulin-like domain containing protein [Candidatus Cloacimonadota bacterium]
GNLFGLPIFQEGSDIHDPLYYSLSSASPCIDAGTPDISELGLPPYDLVGNQRVWNNRIDMGAFEYGSQPWVSNDDPVAPEPGQIALMQNYPNPFNPSTTISYSLPEATKVRLDIYNLKGQLVKSLVNAKQQTGIHSVVWNGNDTNNTPVASGVYLYRVSSQNGIQIKRMLLLK